MGLVMTSILLCIVCLFGFALSVQSHQFKYVKRNMPQMDRLFRDVLGGAILLNELANEVSFCYPEVGDICNIPVRTAYKMFNRIADLENPSRESIHKTICETLGIRPINFKD